MICKRLSNIAPKLPSLSAFSNCLWSSLIRWLTQDSVSKANRSNEDLLRSLLVKGGGTRFNEEGLRNALCMIIKLLSSFVYSALLSDVIRFEICLYRRLVTHNFPPVILCCYHRTRLDIYISQRCLGRSVGSKFGVEAPVYGECKYLNPVRVDTSTCRLLGTTS